MGKAFLGFLIGFITGGLITYKVMEKKIEARYIDEIESMNEDFEDVMEDIRVEKEKAMVLQKRVNDFEERAKIIINNKYGSKGDPADVPDDEDDDIEEAKEEEFGFHKIDKDEYEACIDSYSRKDLLYYATDDVFVSADKKFMIEDTWDIPVDKFDFTKRLEYWKSFDHNTMFKIKYINKSYKDELGFLDPPKPVVKKMKKAASASDN